MTSTADLRLGEIVLTAAGLEAPEREAYLEEIATTAPEIAILVRRRLAAAEGLPDSFLETPAAERLGGPPLLALDLDPSPSRGALPPEERYALGEHLGEGGMGRVIRAFDRQLGRPVALKFLHQEDPAILRLFLHEAQNQARVQHPHVLEIYDSGELDGQPFIAMRFIAGGTLGEVGPTLSVEHRVRLLIQAAEGLHAAHRQGLLHRDVKPSNILVERTPDGELVALVTDFGLATEVDQAATVTEKVAGSPHFIAPERLGDVADAGTVDRRSDVYSLGITLYRLLTGALPFGGQNTLAVLESTLQDKLPPPRLHQPNLPVELEAIILRCVARDPDQRYGSARAVAEDLQRYLDGEVTEAYTAGLAYRLTRFVLRNKLLAGVLGAAAVALLIASVAVAVFAWRADAARQRAEARQGQAEELIRFMVVDLHDKLDTLGRLDVLDEVGEAATEYFAAVPEAELSEAELLGRSRMLYQIGEVRLRQGDLAGAVAPMEQSLALAQQLAQRQPDDGERLFELGQSYFWVGFVHWQQGDLTAARGPFETYLDISRRLVEQDPTHRDWRRELSSAHSNLGSLLQAEGDLEGALDQFLATLALDQELVAMDPANDTARSEVAATHNRVGVVLQDLGRLREAEEHLRADLALRRALVTADPESPRLRDLLATSLSRLGAHLSIQGDWSAAVEPFEEARGIFTALVAHDPTNAPWRLKLAWIDLHLGRWAYLQGDLEAAAEAWRKARGLLHDLLDPGDAPHAWRRSQAVSLYHRALLKVARGNPVGARSDAQDAVQILKDLAAARPTDREVHRWLGQSLLLLGTLEASPSAARLAFEQTVETLAPFARGSRDVRMLAPWARALACLGRGDEARAAAEIVEALGYAEPGLERPCQSRNPGGTT